MNAVSLIGQVVGEPQLSENRAGIPECRIRLAVPRRLRSGEREPGVDYINVTTFGREAQECAERLSDGDRVGLAGRMRAGEALIDQLSFL